MSRRFVAAAVAAFLLVCSVSADAQTETELARPLVGYEKGFFIRTEDGLFALAIAARVQPRWELESLDGEDERTTESAFQIARARLTFSGNVLSRNIEYKFQTDFGKGFVTLKDFYIDYKIGDTEIRIRTGQWKRPFSRAQIASTGNLEFVDRAITDRFFRNQRDIGVAVHNNYEKSPGVEFVAGVFNGGTGDTPIFEGDVTVDPMTGEGSVDGGTFSNVPDHHSPMLLARAGYNHGGIKGYSEADLEGGPLRFGVAAAGLVDIVSDDDSASVFRAGIDYSVKAEGFSSTGGFYVATAQDGDGLFSQGLTAVGFDAQAGYVIASKIQPVARYARILPDGDDNDLQEATLGVSYYSFGHNFKLQVDGSLLWTDTADGARNDYRLRTQLQLAF